MKLKKMLVLIICATILVIGIFPSNAYGQNDSARDSQGGFKDIPQNHWAFEAISWMTENKIAEGTGNGLFSPNKAVARDEFAKMMVLTLKLQLINPEVPSFIDIKRNGWQYKFVETAKPYLTVYKTSNGNYYYHPSEPARREDMAVALVKALGFAGETVDANVLGVFTDADKISPKLKNLVAIAVKHSLVNGYNDAAGNRVFAPQETLTRAQTATLLYSAFKANEEKITYDEEKDVYDGPQDTIPSDDDLYVVPKVKAEILSGKVVVSWDKITSSELEGYKVVVSRGDSSPAYPENGYFQYITDKSVTSSVLQSGDCYNGGDIGGRLKAGEYYYFSITALYGDRKVAGNAVRLKMPGNADAEDDEYSVPKVSAEVVGDKVVVRWDMITSSRLQGYKVVVSKEDATPVYPEDGYYAWITDRDTTSAELYAGDSYNGGDIGGKLEAGEVYYFSVTGYYDSRMVAGNAIRLEMP